ncbi:Peptidase S28, partial [Dillenia turbinata]
MAFTRSLNTFPLVFVFLLVSHLDPSASTPLFKIIPRLSVLREFKHLEGLEKSSNGSKDLSDYKTFYYDQTLDHFNYEPRSFKTFKHRYVLNFKHWGGAQVGAPIFVYMGEEASLDEDVGSIGFLTDNAARFNALLLYIEHRYYGKSVPFGPRKKVMKNPKMRGYFNSAQALADYAEVILHVKKNLSAEASPVIYPHIAHGALASSAPVLYFDNITPQNGYYSVVTRDYQEVSESCYKTIKDSWSEIDRVAAQSNGLSLLSKKFRTCKPLRDANSLKDYLDSLYSVTSQYDRPPKYPVTMVCKGIDGALEGTDVLGRIFAGLVGYRGNKTCFDVGEEDFSSETMEGWSWQRWKTSEEYEKYSCSSILEIVKLLNPNFSDLVIPIGRGSNDTMFPAEPFDLNEYINNIIFSNGLRDPYSSGGVLEDISDSVVAVKTTNGSHCLDILPAKKDDPDWLILQRNIELQIVNGWLLDYYEDLLK